MFNYKTDWGKKYDPMTYQERDSHEVKVFDLKGFVTKLKGDQGAAMPGMMSGMGGGMMPGMMGLGGMSTPPFIPGALNPMAGRMPTNLDEYVKKLDEKIAELEREEEEERKRLEQENKKQQEEIADIKEDAKKTTEELQKDISDILDHKVEVPEKIEISSPVIEVKPVPKVEVTPEVKVTPKIEITPKVEEEEPKFVIPETDVEIEKPNVNIDVDQVTQKPNENSEDFFDDFFGSEDE